MTIIAYARASTAEQSTDVQVEQLTAAGAERIYAENRSATDSKRPELEGALKALREGDVLLVTRLDRLARSVPDLCKIVQQVEAAGAQFRAIHQAFDTSGPTGRLMMNVLATIAQFETELRAERQREGIDKAKAAGKYDPKRHAIPPTKLSWASRYLRGGMSYAQCAEKTGISIDTLQRRFPGYKNPTAVGREAAKKAAATRVSDSGYVQGPIVLRSRSRSGGVTATLTTRTDVPTFNAVTGEFTPASTEPQGPVDITPFRPVQFDTAPPADQTAPEGPIEVAPWLPAAPYPTIYGAPYNDYTQPKPKRRGLLGMFGR